MMKELRQRRATMAVDSTHHVLALVSVLLRVLLLGAVRAALLLLWLLRLRRFEDLQCYYRACITAAVQQAVQST
jgi:hypothetical protein